MAMISRRTILLGGAGAAAKPSIPPDRHTTAQRDQDRLHGGCTCGAFSFETIKAPVARFVCHCLFCQDFTGEAFSDVSVLMAHQVSMKGTATLAYRKYRLPPNLNRAKCLQCGKPARETMGMRPLQLVFLPSKSFIEQSVLPPVRLHVFYNRRVADVADDLPKYSHYWPSQFAITKTVMGL
jgi:hypothetical protein